ncbi:MAG: hypothetical protein ACK6D2_08045 [Planctomycetota bacterium]
MIGFGALQRGHRTGQNGTTGVKSSSSSARVLTRRVSHGTRERAPHRVRRRRVPHRFG